MRLGKGTLLACALCTGLWVHGSAAAADYFINFALLGIASCDTEHIEGNVTTSYNLPAANDNVVVTTSINGGPTTTTYLTFNPPSDSGNAAFTYTIPPTVQPYTITGAVFPALNGAATGTGFSTTYTCNLDGSLTVGFTPATITVTNVPTLSQWALAALAALLALGSLVQVRRRN
jgi:hypothetical protein